MHLNLFISVNFRSINLQTIRVHLQLRPTTISRDARNLWTAFGSWKKADGSSKDAGGNITPNVTSLSSIFLDETSDITLKNYLLETSGPRNKTYRTIKL